MVTQPIYLNGCPKCMKLFKSTILVVWLMLVSCEDQDRVYVDVYESTFPKSGSINQEIEIELKAHATNGCYTDLKIEMHKINDRHFLFKGTAFFPSRSHIECPTVMVNKDTTIVFKPTQTGKYFFQTNESPFAVRKDTITIN